MIIQNLDLAGELFDLRLAEGRIAEIGKGLAGGEIFDGKGGAVIPGLHDHHIHLNALAAAMESVRCGPPEVNTSADLIAALETGDGWLRGVGYHPSVAGEIDRAWLDKYAPARPIRIQHRSGRLWIFNSLAMEALGLSNPENGRLLDGDITLTTRQQRPDLGPLIQRLLSYGITGVTEVTPTNDVYDAAHYQTAAQPLRLSIMGRANLSAAQSPYLKLHYHDHNLPALADLTREISSAYRNGRNVAAHCVTRAELMLTLAAIEQAGAKPGDRIEHAAIADEFAMDWMRRLNLTIVTQPNFIAERVDAYRQDVPLEDQPHLWRLKSFADDGIKLAAGSDAPFGDPNPWAAMAAAVTRPSGFEAESISPEAALALYTKPTENAGAAPRKIAVGEVGDICLLDRPWSEARENLANVQVKATWIGGALVYDAVDQTPV